MQSNAIIQSFWIGKDLSPMEVLCIRSYLFHGHDFHLYVYDDNMKNIPPGTTLMNANEIIPQGNIQIDLFGSWVNFANQFRYALLLKKGGWWVDMDTVCLKPFDFEDDFMFSSEAYEPYNRIQVNNTYIKSLPGAKFLADCLDFIEVRGYDHIHWCELGINLTSRMIFRNELGKYVHPAVTFCPISAFQLYRFFDESGTILPEESYALHWWHYLWTVNKIDKNGNFPATTLYEELKKKYL